MNKAYNKITWQNKPSTATPLNQTNLNEMSNALDTIDDRVIALDNGKVSSVTVTNTLPTGDTIATITVDGTATNIKSAQVEVDDTPSATSENPLQNKAIYEMMNNLLPEGSESGNPIAISDASGLNAKACSVDLLPIQDLHGYDSPWVGGAGKNKLPLSVSGIKALNTSGTWSGNAYTLYSTVFTILTDSDGDVIGVNVNGTPNGGNAVFTLYNYSFDGTSVILNGCPSGGSSSTYRLDAFGGFLAQDIGSGVTINNSGSANVRIVIFENTAISNKVFYPMIRLASVSDATFAPYTNICPISGRNSVKWMRCGKNIVNEVHHGNINSNGTYGTGNTRVTNATSATSSVIKVKAGKYTISAIGLDYATILTKDNFNNIVDNFAGSWQALPYTFTITQTANLYFTARKSDNTTITLADVSVQIEEGETATTYESYQGETHTETLGQTVYGGNADFVNGEGQVELRIISENDFSTVSSDTTPNGFHWADVNIGYIPTFNISNMLPNKNGDSGWGSNVPCFGYVTSGTYKYMRVYCKESTLADFKTAYAGLQIVFSRETPATLSLTAEQISLLKGNNILSTDGDTINITYKAILNS